jgi:hypothetical protein
MNGVLEHLLQRRRDPILEQWLHRILDTYPADSFRFLQGERDRFNNPIGHTLRHGTAVLFDALCSGAEPQAVSDALEEIVKIRAVQEGSAAQAMSFVFLLKTVVRAELGERISDPALCGSLLEFESRVDGLSLYAFDHYLACRERIYAIRAREAARRSAAWPGEAGGARAQGPRRAQDSTHHTDRAGA